MPGGTVVPAEPFGNEAHSYVKEMILQREVDIAVEGMDKGGNFIGWCFEGSTNLSLALVDEGFASSFIMGDKSGYGNQIIMAEEAAKKKKDHDDIFDQVKAAVVENAVSKHMWEEKIKSGILPGYHKEKNIVMGFEINGH